MFILFITMAARRRKRGRRRGGKRRPRKVALHGGIIRGRMHPPTNSASPWNTYVLTTTWKLADTEKGMQCIALKTLAAAVRTELGLTTDQKLSFRVLRLDVWTPPSLAGSDRNFIVMAPSDWTDASVCASVRTINWYEAWGTAVQPAHLHYVWPRSISNIVLDNADLVLCRFDIKEKCQYILKFHCMWRPSAPDPRPTFGGEFVSVRASRQIATEQDDDFEEVEELAGGIAHAL